MYILNIASAIKETNSEITFDNYYKQIGLLKKEVIIQ